MGIHPTIIYIARKFNYGMNILGVTWSLWLLLNIDMSSIFHRIYEIKNVNRFKSKCNRSNICLFLFIFVMITIKIGLVFMSRLDIAIYIKYKFVSRYFDRRYIGEGWWKKYVSHLFLLEKKMCFQIVCRYLHPREGQYW